VGARIFLEFLDHSLAQPVLPSSSVRQTMTNRRSRRHLAVLEHSPG